MDVLLEEKEVWEEKLKLCRHDRDANSLTLKEARIQKIKIATKKLEILDYQIQVFGQARTPIIDKDLAQLNLELAKFEWEHANEEEKKVYANMIDAYTSELKRGMIDLYLYLFFSSLVFHDPP